MRNVEFVVDEEGYFVISDFDALRKSTRRICNGSARRDKREEIIARLPVARVPARCINGHFYDEENLYITTSKKIRCRQCRTNRRWKRCAEKIEDASALTILRD